MLSEGKFNFFKVDGSSGISIGFDDEAIPLNDNLNNDPGIDNLAKMKFQLHNLLASDATGPAMGTTGAFAYNNMDWLNGTSLAYAVSENTDLLNSVDGITVDMTGFELFDFEDVLFRTDESFLQVVVPIFQEPMPAHLLYKSL